MRAPEDDLEIQTVEGAVMAAAVALSVLGMAYHTVMEFGLTALLSPASGMIPVAGVQLFFFAAWWLSKGKTPWTRALMITGLFQLIGGAIISVLPLPFLPFRPEQSLEHYQSHLVLGLAQLPLIGVPLYLWRRQGTPHTES